MPRTLVIQLGRIGDVIQTTPLLSELAASGDEVDVLVLHSAHTALLGCPAIANIVTISDALKPLDDAIACGFPHGKIPTEAGELLAGLQLPRYDRVVQASHAPIGCWLAGEISCANPHARYGGIIRSGECLYFGAASVYRVAMLQFREQNLFNLVDLIRAIPGIPPQSAQPRLYANQSSEPPFALPRGRKVALNPGASEAARCWPAENFSRLAEALSTAGFVPLLVGAPSDRERSEMIAAAANVAIPNFAGRTTVPEMAALLARCELLVSSDTGAAHLAAAVGTKVVGLYGSTAWFAETAPYGDDQVILQTPLNAPMSAISVDVVIAAALNRLNRLSTIDFHRELHIRNQSAWETSIQPPSASDPLGGLTYRPLHRDSLTSDELFAKSLRQSFAMEFVAEIPTSPEATEALHVKSDRGCELHSLARILDHLQAVANTCADSIRNRTASLELANAASALASTMEKLRALATEPMWRSLRPVIHDLDWQLRMLPPQNPDATLRAFAQAYASAARILLRANADAPQHSIADEKNQREGKQ